MIARFQTYASVLRFVSFIGDIDHIIKIKEIIDPKDSRRIKGWEVQHQPVTHRIELHYITMDDPHPAEEAMADLRRKWDEHFDPNCARKYMKAKPAGDYSYTVPFRPGRES